MKHSDNDYNVGVDIGQGNSSLSNVSTATIDGSSILSSAISGDFWTTANSNTDQHIKTTPFVDSMPYLSEVKEMCDEYPALAKAYENFKTVYTMVNQDWKGKEK